MRCRRFTQDESRKARLDVEKHRSPPFVGSVEMLGASADTPTSETSTKIWAVSSGLLQTPSSPS